MRQIATPASMVAWQIVAVLIASVALVLVIATMPPLLMLGAIAAVLLGTVFLQRPDVGLLALLVVRASTDATLGSFAATMGVRGGVLGLLLNPNTTLILMVIVVGGVFVLSRGLPFISLPAGRAYTLLLLVGLVGILRSNRLLFSVGEWLPAASVIVVYSLAANLFRDPGRIQRVIDVIAVSFILPAAVGFRQFVFQEGRLQAGLVRIEGTFVHPNAFAFYLVIVFSVFLSQALIHSGRRRIVSLLIVAAAGVLLLGTYTRAAWVGVVVVLIVLGAARSRAILFLVPLLGGLVYTLVPSIAVRLADPLGGSFADRLRIWGILLRRWVQVTGESQAPIVVALDRLTGLGPGAFITIFPGGVTFPHNDYLRLLIEYGVLGVLFFVAIHAILIRMGYTVYRRSQGVMSAVALGFLGVAVAFPIISLTDNLFAMTVNQVYYWTLAGLVVGIGWIIEQSGSGPVESLRRSMASPVGGRVRVGETLGGRVQAGFAESGPFGKS